jgi:hypothetical protein
MPLSSDRRHHDARFRHQQAECQQWRTCMVYIMASNSRKDSETQSSSFLPFVVSYPVVSLWHYHKTWTSPNTIHSLLTMGFCEICSIISPIKTNYPKVYRDTVRKRPRLSCVPVKNVRLSSHVSYYSLLKSPKTLVFKFPWTPTPSHTIIHRRCSNSRHLYQPRANICYSNPCPLHHRQPQTPTSTNANGLHQACLIRWNPTCAIFTTICRRVGIAVASCGRA